MTLQLSIKDYAKVKTAHARTHQAVVIIKTWASLCSCNAAPLFTLWSLLLPSSFCFCPLCVCVCVFPFLPFAFSAVFCWGPLAANGRVESPQPLSLPDIHSEKWCSATETRSWGGTTGNKSCSDRIHLAPTCAFAALGKFPPRINFIIRWARFCLQLLCAVDMVSFVAHSPLEHRAATCTLLMANLDLSELGYSGLLSL